MEYHGDVFAVYTVNHLLFAVFKQIYGFDLSLLLIGVEYFAAVYNLVAAANTHDSLYSYGFAAAGLAYYGHRFAFVKSEVYTPDCVEISPGGFK